MASLSSDANGNRTVRFVAGDGKRRSIRLGKVSKKVAEGVKLRVEALSAAAVTRLPLDGETAAWVAGGGDDLAAKLAAVGLIPPRSSRSLADFLAGYVEARRADGSKPATVVTVRRTVYRRLKMAKMLFGHAAKLGLIPANPFADVKSKNHNTPDRLHYVTPADARRLCEVAAPVWRTIIASPSAGRTWTLRPAG